MNIEEIKQEILSKCKPVFFIDTCSILDVIRTGFRDNIRVTHLDGVINIIEKLKTNELLIVLVQTVVDEVAEHKEPTFQEFIQEQNRLKKILDKSLEIANILGIDYSIEYTNNSIISLNDSIAKIVDDLLANSLILAEDDSLKLKAFNRMTQNIAPSQRGKSEIKDCVIIEHYIELTSRLRLNGFTEKVVFITNNPKDFGPAPTAKPPLDDTFSTLNIKYCNEFKWALALI
ncbi:MAG: PIN domain-containing protein [Sulfuricurvum sp.]|nr:PIN domain-containing protein [Sulfuricurvum sp.]